MRTPRHEPKPPADTHPPNYAPIDPTNVRDDIDSADGRPGAVSPLTPDTETEATTSPWVATVTLDNAREGNYSTKTRLSAISKVICGLATEGYPSGGVLLFPGGWLDTGDAVPDAEYCTRAADAIMPALEGTGHAVCFGIDGGADADGFARDQLALVVRDGEGICAMGRKFAPSPQERGRITLCENYWKGEAGYSRTFMHCGRTYFPAVCYDSYGISHGAGPNPGVDAVLNCVHCFYPKGQGPSGDPYFARHGFAGAAKQWSCPVYGTAIFYDRSMPPAWPTGVAWNRGEKSTTRWRYDENPLAPDHVFAMMNEEGLITVRVFHDGE